MADFERARSGPARMIATGNRAKVERLSYEAKDTTHVCVVDRDGNAVSMTHSHGMPSGVITDGQIYVQRLHGCVRSRPGNADSLAPGKVALAHFAQPWLLRATT